MELSTTPAASAVESATTTGMEAAASGVTAAKAGLSSEGIGSGNPSMIEPTEGAGVCACLCVRSVGPVKSLMPRKTSVA